MPVDILAHIICQQPSAAVRTMQPAAALLHVVECYCWYTHLHSGKIWAALDGQPALVLLLNTGSIAFTGRHELVIHDGFFCNGVLENTYLEKITAGTRLLVIKFKADGWAHLEPLLLNAKWKGMMPSVTALHSTSTISAISTGAAQRIAFPPIIQLPSSLLLLLTAIRKAAHPEQQAALLNKVLAQQLPNDITGNFLLQSATHLIRQHKGRIAVASLCTALKVNYKWLERNFRIATGVTPKHYINNIRFLHAWLDVHSATQPLTGIALDNGYYDQTHFIKAYKKYTGMLPSAAK